MRCVIPALLLLVAACGGKPTDAAKPAYRMPVLAEAAAQRPLTQEVRAGGTLEPDEIVQIATRVAGVAERVAVREGQVVAEGEVLVEIEPQRFRIAVDRARAALAKAEAQVEEAHASLTRREELATRGNDLVPVEELAAWRSRLAQAQADVALARAGLAQAELDAANATVRAPLAGTIESRAVRLGQYLPIGALVATQVRRLPLRLSARVPAAEAALLVVGQAVHAQVGTQRLPGTLVQVGAAADPASRTVPVLALIPDADASVVAGGFAELVAAVGGTAERLAVPASALRAGERGWTAFVIEGAAGEEIARRRTIRPGLRSADGWVEVVEGIAAGERVVMRGADALRDGQAVTIQAAER